VTGNYSSSIKDGLSNTSGVESSVPLTEFVHFIVLKLNKKKMCSTDMNRTPVHQILSNRRMDIRHHQTSFLRRFWYICVGLSSGKAF